MLNGCFNAYQWRANTSLWMDNESPLGCALPSGCVHAARWREPAASWGLSWRKEAWRRSSTAPDREGKSIDCITETWNLVAAAASGDLLWASSSVTRPLPGLRGQTPRPPGGKRFGNHSAWQMREGQDPCLICSQGKPEVSLKSEMWIRCHYLLKCCCGAAHSLLDSWLCCTSCPQPNTNPPTMSLKALKGKNIDRILDEPV